MLPAYFPDERHNNLVKGRHGYILFNRNDPVIGASIVSYGEYFESEVGLFRQVIRPGSQVADLGATIGTHTVALARIVTDSGWGSTRSNHSGSCSKLLAPTSPSTA